MKFMSEFLGIGGYQRVPEGYMSWQHLTFVTALMIVMTALSVYFGTRKKHASKAEKNRVLMVSAVLMDTIEITRIILACVAAKDASKILQELPLFLCSLQLIAIPLAAFSKGRVQEAATDFVMMFGLLGTIFGTYFAGQNYASYPVLSVDNVTSGVTHAIAGFSALYIMICGLVSMKKENTGIIICILLAFCSAAYLANVLIDYNYMFLMSGDGTPYDMFYNLVNGNAVLYPLIVVGLFLAYIAVFVCAYRRIACLKKGKRQSAD